MENGISFVRAEDEDSIVKIQEWKSDSSQRNLKETLKSYLFGWTKFESLVLISLILLNSFLIGVLFPIVSTSLSTLDNLIDKQDIVSFSLNENSKIQRQLDQKVDKIANTGKIQQDQLVEIDGKNLTQNFP